MTNIILDILFLVLGIAFMAVSGDEAITTIGFAWALYGTVALAVDFKSVHRVKTGSRRG